MYNVVSRPGVIDGYGYGWGHPVYRGYDSSCCENWNFYKFPRPIGKVQRLLDTTKLEIHTDEFVGESCFHRGPCCEPIPVKVEEKVKSFIIHAATDCLEPGVYYTLHINHPLPLGIFAEPTFIRVEKCGLFKDPIKLVYTKTVFPICEFDKGEAIPADPAFPYGGVEVEWEGDAIPSGAVSHVDGVGVAGPLVVPDRFRNMNAETRLIPVELDLHGNTAFGDNFVRGITPHPKLIQLFFTNRGTFSLVRSWRRRTDY